MSTVKLRLVSVAAALVLLGAVPAAASAKTTITMSGSTSVAPLAALLARKYVKHHHVAFKLQQGGSDVGIADVAAGAVSIGNSSRDPKPGDPGGLVFNKIAKDAICITTNKANKVPQISQNGVQAIFGGDVRNWSGVPGSPRNGTIDVYVRTAGLRYPGRLPEDLHGLHEDLLGGDPAGLERADPAAGQQATRAGSDTSPCSSPRRTGRSPTPAFPARCATPSPVSTAACATSTWSPGARPTGP